MTCAHAQPLSITLKGITNDHLDPSIDVIRTVTLPLLKRLGVEDNGLELKVRGGWMLCMGALYCRHQATLKRSRQFLRSPYGSV